MTENTLALTDNSYKLIESSVIIMNKQTQNLTAIVIRFDVVRNIPRNSEMALLAEKYEQLNFSLHGQKQGETQVMLDSRCQPDFVYVTCEWFVYMRWSIDCNRCRPSRKRNVLVATATTDFDRIHFLMPTSLSRCHTFVTSYESTIQSGMLTFGVLPVTGKSLFALRQTV